MVHVVKAPSPGDLFEDLSRDEILEMTRAFFLSSMAGGWAANGPTSLVPGKPGCMQYVCGEGDWFLIDEWCVNPDTGQSAGMTTVWFRGKPVWNMVYGGYYPESVVPVVRRALLAAYREGLFNGGRGVARFEWNSMVYLNSAQSRCFHDFHGREEVYSQDTSGKCLGWLWYMGKSLI